jgi:hypothetical protein
MALVLADRVKETTTTTGTGTVTLLGASTGFQSFAVVGNANTTYYTIAAQTGTEWEVGIGTYTSAGTLLARTTVLSSSNAGSLVNFSAGTKDVFVTYPSSRSIYADGTTLTATNSSILPATSGGTSFASYAVGDILYASTTTALSKLADVATGNAIISGGVGVAPSYGKIGLTTHVSGTLPIANGGTNSTATATAGGISYGTGTAYAVTAAGTAGQVITSAGAGVPTWTTATNANTASAIVQRDASGNFSAGTITAALSGNATTATSATSATSATTATNLAGGSAGTVPYQSAAGTTVQLAAGTSTYLLQSNGAAAPSWVAPVAAANNGTLTMAVSGTGLSGSGSFTANQAGASSFTVTSNATNLNTASTIVARDASGNFTAGTITAALSGNATTATSATSATTATTATNLAGGAASQIPYQTGSGATTFIANGTSGQVLTSNGASAPSWQTSTAASKSYAQAMRILAL